LHNVATGIPEQNRKELFVHRTVPQLETNMRKKGGKKGGGTDERTNGKKNGSKKQEEER
jgi:hypothetical protein